MLMRPISLLLVTLLAAPGCAVTNGRPRLSALPSAQPDTQAPSSAADQADVWRRYVSALPIGGAVRITLTDGSRFKATLMVVEADAVVVKPRKRLPEPARRVPFTAIETIEPEGTGIGAGKAALIGVAVGAASFLALFLLAVAAVSD